MRHVRMVGVLAVVLGAFAVSAAPSFAVTKHFVSSRLEKSIGRGFEEIVSPEYEPARMQEFKFGTFKILCYRAKAIGQVTEFLSETFTTTIKFSQCGWYPQNNSLHVKAGFSKSGLTIVFHANGYTEALGNGEGEEYEFKKATILETAAYVNITSSKICKIVIPEQTIPVKAVKKPFEQYSAAVYSNEEVPNGNATRFPSGFQKRLVIANEFKKMLYKYAGEETQCATAPEFEKQSEEGGGGVSGIYKGSLEEWIGFGDLSFE